MNELDLSPNMLRQSLKHLDNQLKKYRRVYSMRSGQ